MQMTLFQIERELNRRLSPWLDEAESIREFCLQHGVAVPTVMLPLFGDQHLDVASVKPLHQVVPSASKKHAPSISRTHASSNYVLPPMPNYGSRPLTADESWVPVPLRGASVAVLLLHLMAMVAKPIGSAELITGLAKYRKKAGASTVSMTLKKLQEDGWIGGDFEAWHLLKEAGGIISGDRLWCPLNQLRSSDRAAIRREVLLPALQINKSMTTTTLANCLRDCRWLRIPIDSNLIKADCRILQKQGKIRKEGMEWEFVKF